MLPTLIAIIAVVFFWGAAAQRRLAVLDQNSSNAMGQVGVQLSWRFDALLALLDCIRDCALDEVEALKEAIKARGGMITAQSTLNDVLHQEVIIAKALNWVTLVAEQRPELQAEPTYIEALGAAYAFQNMMRTSRLIYNDSVAKLNREIRKFPVSIVAGTLGFRQREYLEEQTTKAVMPSSK